VHLESFLNRTVDKRKREGFGFIDYIGDIGFHQIGISYPILKLSFHFESANDVHVDD
jgi:hypothetical protein